MVPGRRFRPIVAVGLLFFIVQVRPSVTTPMLEDDYLVNRPWSRAEVLSTWHGTWNPGVPDARDAYFRPLTATWQAAMFELFGWNQVARHAMSLLLFAALAAGIGVFAWRDGGAVAACATSAAIIVSPLTPIALSGWTFSQFHECAALCAIGAGLIWQRARTHTWASWVPAAGLILIGALFKEDTIVVAPLLLLWQLLHSELIGDAPRPSRAVLLVLAAPIVITLALRFAFLDPAQWWSPVGVAAAGWTSATTSWDIVRHAVGWMGLWADHLRAPLVASLAAIAIEAAAFLWLARRPDWRRGRLCLYGLMAVICATGPLLLSPNTNHTRGHLAAVAGAILIGGSAAWLWHTVSRGPRFALVTIRMDGYLASCRDNTNGSAEDVARDYPWLDPTVHAWLIAQSDDCSAGTWRPVDAAVSPVRWRRPLPGVLELPSAVVLSRPGAALRMRLSAATPTTVMVEIDGQAAAPWAVDATERDFTITPTAGWRTRLRGGHLVRVRAANGESVGVSLPGQQDRTAR